jgi:hypothetical protein
VCAIVWTYANSPQATGALISGEVLHCGTSNLYVDNHWCMVRIDHPREKVRVYMPPQSPGQKLTLIKTLTRLTGRVHYIVRYGPTI